jgi:hypothetical protein
LSALFWSVAQKGKSPNLRSIFKRRYARPFGMETFRLFVIWAIFMDSLDGRHAYHMVQHLIDTGANIHTASIVHCETRCVYVLRNYRKTSCRALTDCAKIAVAVCREIKERLARSNVLGNMKTVLILVLNGKIRVPVEPIPFQLVAKDMLTWLNGANSNDAAAV